MSSFFPELHKHYSNLTPAEKRIADHILRYPSETVNLSAAALAARAGTAASAVVRLCRSLGYQGFSDFKLQLAVELRRQPDASYMPGISRQDDTSAVLDKIFSANIKALQDTAARLDRQAFQETVTLLQTARSIHIYAVGTSAPLAQELQHRLMLLGLQSHAYTDVAAMRLSTMNLCRGDVAFGISHTGRTLATAEALALSRAAGATTVCLTSYFASPITDTADQVLTVYSDDTRYPIEAVSARIAQTGVIDALVAALSVSRYDHALERSERIHGLMESIRRKEKKK